MKSVERFLLPPYLWGHRNIHFSLGNRWLDHPRLKKLRMGLGIQFGKLEISACDHLLDTGILGQSLGEVVEQPLETQKARQSENLAPITRGEITTWLVTIQKKITSKM